MPITIRHLGLNTYAASYTFPKTQEQADSQNLPWLQAPVSTRDLCSVCSQLNLRWFFSEHLAGYTVSDGTYSAQLTNGICLGNYAEISQRPGCVLCQLLVYAIEEGADIDMLNDYDDWPQQDVWLSNHFIGRREQVASTGPQDDHVVRLGVRLRAKNQSSSLISLGQAPITLQIVQDSESLATTYAGRTMAQGTKELICTIQGWLRPCLSACNSTTTINKREDAASIRLIDTMKACIVGPMQGEEYVALSYTWGKIDPLVLLKENEKDLRQEGALREQGARLPQTIRDCMLLCQLLGKQYMWVDSLCIMQDTIDKHDQIQQMDKIYQEATLCVVAAAGKDANAGLPGVSGRRDICQRIVKIGGLELSNTVRDLTTSVGQSFWISRGWCFQESLLSSRKLIFSADQTYYYCQHGEYREDVHDAVHDDSGPVSGEVPFRITLMDKSNWSIYRNIVASYTMTYLSFSSDILNAFTGISSFLSKMIFLGCPFFMGIPLCSLDVGLLWHPASRLEQRSGASFPSWAWAGWIGIIEYDDDVDNVFDRTLSRAELCLVSKDHAFQSPVVTSGNPPEDWTGWEDWTRSVHGLLNQIQYSQSNMPTDHWFSHPIKVEPWPIPRSSSMLQCTTDVAEMVLTGEHADIWYQSCEEDLHEVCRLQVRDLNGHKAGIVVMDGATFEKTSFTRRLFSFIKISQTTLASRDDPAWDDESKTFKGRPGEPAIVPHREFGADEEEFDQKVYDSNICWCMYNVLVVEIDEDAARRIAVGRVHITAFDNASPQQRTLWLK